jgi:uncharacterized RDD family membrane protein YckC
MVGETLVSDGGEFPADGAGSWRESWSDLSPHPLRRWVARNFDGFITAGVVCAGLASPLALSESGRYAPLGIVLMLFWVGPVRGLVSAVLNALLLHWTTTTPGKWLCGVRIVRRDGGRLTFGRALKRELHAYVGGCGLYIPVAVLVLMASGFRVLRRNGATPWDERGELVAVQRPAGWVQTLLTLLAFLSVAAAMATSAALAHFISDAALGGQQGG